MNKAQRFLVPVLAAAVWLAALLVELGNAQALDQVLYVAPGGNCGGAAPCYATIQAAIDQSAAGDEIRVATGVYSGVNTQGGLSQVAYLTKSISLRGGFTTADWNTPNPTANPTTLDANNQGRAVAIIGPADVTLEGLTLTNGNAAGLRGDPNNPTSVNTGGGMYIRSADVTLRRLTITGNAASREASKNGLGGGIYAYGSRIELRDSRVESNIASPVYHGSGGGLYIDNCPDVTLADNLIQDNTGSTNQGNAGGGNGGGIAIWDSRVWLLGNTIQYNTGTTGPGTLSSASGGGVYVSEVHGTSHVTLTNNLITGNTASLQKEGWGGGVAIGYGSTGRLDGNTIQDNTATGGLTRLGQGGGVYFSGGSLTMHGNIVQNNTAGGGSSGNGYGGGVSLITSAVTLTQNIILSNHASLSSNGAGGGLYVEDTTFRMENNILSGNQASTRGSGMLVSSATTPGNLGRIFHTTIADNTGSGDGVYLANRARLEMTNSIIAGHSRVGITVTVQASVSYDSTLWHANNLNSGGTGAITPQRDVTGDPAFIAPLTGDYHISAISAAVDRGIGSPVVVDIDGQPRPNGAAADLGADEYYSQTGAASAEKAAFPPQWFATFDPASGLFHNYLSQRYLLQFRHYDPIGLPVWMTDTLPTSLTFAAQRTSPAMNFGQQGQVLSWQTQQPLPGGQAAQVLLTAFSEQVAPGTTITNQAEVRTGGWQFDLQAASQVPLVPPLITAPGPGEICPGVLQVSGVTVPNTTVTLYIDGAQAGVTVADAHGAFSHPINPSGLGQQRRVLTAIACTSGAPGQCSSSSHAVTLDPPLTFICPQPSTWEHTPPSGPLAGQHLVYRFRNQAGLFVGDGAHFSFVPPHAGSGMHLYAKSCEQMGTPPVTSESVWVDVYEGALLVATYHPASIDKPWYHVVIAMELADGVERDVIARLGCIWPGRSLNNAGAAPTESTTFSANLNALVDQGGVIFDVTQGLDPAHPELSAVEGVTVTAMISDTAWGGWVPWPAHLYNNQANPQVTGADGYFTFFAPPGIYYLQVDGGAGYYSWRSPQYQIGSAPLHLDIPLTPRRALAQQVVSLMAAGPSPQVVQVSAGQSVEWFAPLDSTLSITQSMSLADNPQLRLHTTGALDPLLNPLGWDAGMLPPGSIFRLRFTQPGSYPYTDGAGHSGTVIVPFRLFMPVVQR